MQWACAAAKGDCSGVWSLTNDESHMLPAAAEGDCSGGWLWTVRSIVAVLDVMADVLWPICSKPKVQTSMLYMLRCSPICCTNLLRTMQYDQCVFTGISQVTSCNCCLIPISIIYAIWDTKYDVMMDM